MSQTTPSPAALRDLVDRIWRETKGVGLNLTLEEWKACCACDITKFIDAEFRAEREEMVALNAVYIWFRQRLSEENCMGTIVDVFTSIREDLEDEKSFREAINAALQRAAQAGAKGGT